MGLGIGDIIKKEYINYADINEEINHYKEIRSQLILYLDKYPLIKSTKFKEKSNKLYVKSKCNFEIKTNTFKNIYYNWRIRSNFHNKFSIFNCKKSLNNKNFLRDYCFTLLYDNNGKKLY